MNNSAYIRAVFPAAAIPNPPAQIAIAVDTAYVVGAGGKSVSGGIYLVDNQLETGSSGEGGTALQTVVAVESLIGFSTYPIDHESGDTVAITGFDIVEGNVFSSLGYPIPQTPDYWIGQAINIGTQTYRIQICVTSGGLRSAGFYVQLPSSRLTAR